MAISRPGLCARCLRRRRIDDEADGHGFDAGLAAHALGVGYLETPGPLDARRRGRTEQPTGGAIDPSMPRAFSSLAYTTVSSSGPAAVEAVDAETRTTRLFLRPRGTQRCDFERKAHAPGQITAVGVGARVFERVSAVDGLDGGWTLDDTVRVRKGAEGARHRRGRLLLRWLFGSATAARVKRTWGFRYPTPSAVRREAGIKSMAVGLIVDPFVAEDILRKGRADLIAIGAEALVNPCWPQMAEIALGRKGFDAMDEWPVQYGWWLKLRERSIDQIRADEAASR